MAFSTPSKKKPKYDFSSITEDNPLVVKNPSSTRILIRISIVYIMVLWVAIYIFLSNSTSLLWLLSVSALPFIICGTYIESITWKIYRDRVEKYALFRRKRVLLFREYTHFEYGVTNGGFCHVYKNAETTKPFRFDFPSLGTEFYKGYKGLHIPYMINDDEVEQQEWFESIRFNEKLGTTEGKRIEKFRTLERITDPLLWFSILLSFTYIFPAIRLYVLHLMILSPFILIGIMRHIKSLVDGDTYQHKFKFMLIISFLPPLTIFMMKAFNYTRWDEILLLLKPAIVLFFTFLIASFPLMKLSLKRKKRATFHVFILLVSLGVYSWSIPSILNRTWETGRYNNYNVEVVEIVDTLHKKKKEYYMVVKLPPEALYSKVAYDIERDTYQVGDSVQLKEYIGLFGVCTGYELVEEKDDE